MATRELEKNEVLTVSYRRVRISCVLGSLWITTGSGRADLHLAKGERVLLERCRRIVVQAMSPSTIVWE